jgi:hypothetical protein
MNHPGLLGLAPLAIFCLSEMLYGSAKGRMLTDPHLIETAWFSDISGYPQSSMPSQLFLSQKNWGLIEPIHQFLWSKC